ncbi:nesprin-2 [Synchiropus picturatus]
MKPGVDPSYPGQHGDVPSEPDQCDEAWRDSSPVLESQTDLDWDDMLQLDHNWTLDQPGSGPLEQRWVLWQDFMKEHAHLDSWLQAAQQALSSSNTGHVTFAAACEDLSRFEKLRCEAGSRLPQLEGLTRKNRTLTRLFQGSMQARLLALARNCSLRWDDVNVRLEGVTRRLKLFLSEWEEFEAERAELAQWLTDLNVRLTDVDLLTGSTCEKLQCLQSFQHCVCVNSERVNALLQRGESLMQRSETSDAQRVESRLLELLRSCSDVYSNIARTHTRLLSMRLVFEDDWILPRASDSGCPSESLLEDDGALNLDLLSAPPADSSPSPPRSASPVHEHLGLEWDPSVDVGRSLTPDGADSSYFSTSTGPGHRDGLKRRSYLSSLGSWSDISNDVINQEPNLASLRQTAQDSAPRPPSFVSVRDPRPGPSSESWSTSTPDRDAAELFGYGGRRVRAWLGVHSSANSDEPTSWCKAVQTEPQEESHLGMSQDAAEQLPVRTIRHCSENTSRLGPGAAPALSHDLAALPGWTREKLQLEEESCCDEAEQLR